MRSFVGSFIGGVGDNLGTRVRFVGSGLWSRVRNSYAGSEERDRDSKPGRFRLIGEGILGDMSLWDRDVGVDAGHARLLLNRVLWKWRPFGVDGHCYSFEARHLAVG